MGGKLPKIPEMNENGFILHMNPDLKLSYIESHRKLIDGRLRLQKELDGISYQRSKQHEDSTTIEILDDRANEINKDIALIDDMITDINVGIAWISTGGDPHSKRGIQRRDVYRKKLMDPLIMQSFSNQYNSRSSSTLTQSQLFQLEDALSRLSPVERTCYTMQHGQGFYAAYIARLLGITEQAVKTMVKRAQAKVSQDMQSSLFLMDYDIKEGRS